jgi:ubiquinone/menaquinone biosynthesis C-methylase UbiE
LEKEEIEKYWDYVALEAKDFEKTLRLEKWRKAARNWLANYADKRARDFVLKVINEVVKLDKSAKVLDVGCGPGKWAMLLAKKCSSVTAIDISPKMILLARENARKQNLNNIRFHVMSVSKLNMQDQTFDVVNCVTVLQHIFDDDEWRNAIREIARVTKKGGYTLLLEAAPNFAIKKRTPHLSIRTMQQYVNEFEKSKIRLIYWRPADLSLPVTFLGLRNYAASFNEKVYYFVTGGELVSPSFKSLLSRIAAMLAGQIDYKLAETPLSFLSFHKILLFRKSTA